MGKDIELDWRETNPGNGATASISGELVTPKGGAQLVRGKHGVQGLQQNEASGGRKEYATEN